MLVLVLLLATMMFRRHSCIDMSRQRSVPEAGQSTEPRQRPGPELWAGGNGSRRHTSTVLVDTATFTPRSASHHFSVLCHPPTLRQADTRIQLELELCCKYLNPVACRLIGFHEQGSMFYLASRCPSLRQDTPHCSCHSEVRSTWYSSILHIQYQSCHPFPLSCVL